MRPFHTCPKLLGDYGAHVLERREGSMKLLEQFVGDRIAKGVDVSKRISKRNVQNISFAANCSCRDDPNSPVGKRVFVMTPKFGLPTMFPG